MRRKIYQVDSFTETPFSGNPAAVCILDGPAPEPLMQSVASEMNLAETAFLYRAGDGYNLRWFTPAVEVDLCGHATLASAHVLWEAGHLDAGETARFQTRSGLLTAVKAGDWIEMDFPAKPVSPVEDSSGLVSAVGGAPVYCGKGDLDYLLQYATEEEVRALAPDFRALARLGLRGVIATAEDTGPEFDFISRFFAPGAGIDEDPVTGSAHCALGPFWRERLGRDEFTAFQASKRGGVVRVAVRGDRILLSGKAVTVLCGELLQLKWD